MNEDFWKDKYPAGIAAEINPDEYPNIQAVLNSPASASLTNRLSATWARQSPTVNCTNCPAPLPRTCNSIPT
jgi:hypothetical protein